jgi:hypothetical protein
MYSCLPDEINLLLLLGRFAVLRIPVRVPIPIHERTIRSIFFMVARRWRVRHLASYTPWGEQESLFTDPLVDGSSDSMI